MGDACRRASRRPGGDRTKWSISVAGGDGAREKPIEYPIDPLAARGSETVLVGRHSSFKTWLMTVAGHVAHRSGGDVADLRC